MYRSIYIALKHIQVDSRIKLEIISSLKSDKSPGIDGFVAEIFKCLFDIIPPLLLRLLNIIFLNFMVSEL